MGKLYLSLIGCCMALVASVAFGQNDPSAEPTGRPNGMLTKLLHGNARMGRHGVPADAYEAQARAEEPYNPREVFITDEYGFNYDRRGHRIR
jgi:hypothetical protein